jgi:hypothetical protein
VRSRASAATGTPIQAQASVVFDTNAPIITNAVSNVLDNGAPTSSVVPLPFSINTPSFTVTWAGADDAAQTGIASYDVYVSMDGSAFTPWLIGTTQTSAVFTGVLDHVGHAYAFYSIATDGLGFRQPTPAAPASTFLLAPIPDEIVQKPVDQVRIGRRKIKQQGNRWQVAFTLTNRGGPIVGPLFLVLNGLSRKVKLLRSTGAAVAQLRFGFPSLDLVPEGNVLQAGEILSVRLIFQVPVGQHLHYMPLFLAGTDMR